MADYPPIWAYDIWMEEEDKLAASVQETFADSTNPAYSGRK